MSTNILETVSEHKKVFHNEYECTSLSDVLMKYLLVIKNQTLGVISVGLVSGTVLKRFLLTELCLKNYLTKSRIYWQFVKAGHSALERVPFFIIVSANAISTKFTNLLREICSIQDTLKSCFILAENYLLKNT